MHLTQKIKIIYPNFGRKFEEPHPLSLHDTSESVPTNPAPQDVSSRRLHRSAVSHSDFKISAKISAPNRRSRSLLPWTNGQDLSFFQTHTFSRSIYLFHKILKKTQNSHQNLISWIIENLIRTTRFVPFLVLVWFLGFMIKRINKAKRPHDVLAGQFGLGFRSQMSDRSRCPPPSSFYPAKRPSVSDNPIKKVTRAAKPQLAKKRPALADVSNQRNGSKSNSRTSLLSSKPLVRLASLNLTLFLPPLKWQFNAYRLCFLFVKWFNCVWIHGNVFD